MKRRVRNELEQQWLNIAEGMNNKAAEIKRRLLIKHSEELLEPKTLEQQPKPLQRQPITIDAHTLKPLPQPAEKKAPTKRRVRGEGGIFQKKGYLRPDGTRVPDDVAFTIQYYKPDAVSGKRVCIRERGFKTKTEAAAALRDRTTKVDKGERFESRPKYAKTVADLYEAFFKYVENRGVEDAEEAIAKAETAERKRLVTAAFAARKRKRETSLALRWRHLEPVFGAMLAKDVLPLHIDDYRTRRNKEKAAKATTNRECAVLRRIYNFGLEKSLVYSAPVIKLPEEENARQGFVSEAEFERLVAAAEKGEFWLQALVECAFTLAWRRAELLGLTRAQVDFDARTVSLYAGMTKNGKGRVCHLNDRLLALLKDATTGKQPSDYVFTRPGAPADRPIRDFRKLWSELLKRAGIDRKILLHDFRRSGVRALRRAGVPEGVCMTIAGMKTREIFERYDIKNLDDQRDAMRDLESARERDRAERAKNERRV